MKDLTHIRRFNESEENLNISDVSDSYFDFIEELVSNKDGVKLFGGDNFDVANYWFSVGIVAMKNKKVSQMRPKKEDFKK
jgi:hypothetical protein